MMMVDSRTEARLRQLLSELADHGVPGVPSRRHSRPAAAGGAVVDLEAPPVADTRSARRRSRPVLVGVIAAFAAAVAALGLSPNLASFGSGDTSTEAKASPMTEAPIAVVSDPATATLANGAVFVWGGRSSVAPGDVAGEHAGDLSAAGAVFDPATQSWKVTPAGPLSPRSMAVAVPVGDEVIVTGGLTGDGAVSDGAVFAPATSTWRRLAAAPICPLVGAALGTNLYAAGACSGDRGVPFAALDTQTWQWVRLAQVPMDGVSAIVPMGDGRLFAWNEGDRAAASYDPAADSWTPMPLPDIALPMVTGQVAASFPLDGDGVLLILGIDTDTGPSTVLYSLDAGGWTLVGRVDDSVPKGLGVLVGDRVVWPTGHGFAWIDRNGEIGETDEIIGSLNVDRTGAALAAAHLDGKPVLFFWGGRSRSPEAATASETAAEGALVQFIE